MARRNRRNPRRAIGALEAQRGGSAPHINVTPLIDVVMVLIIFYLIVGQLVMDRRGEVELPSAREGEQEDPRDRPIIVMIGAADEVLVEGQRVEPARAGRVVAGVLASEPDRPVQIRGARTLPYRDVEPVLDALRDAGIRTVRLAARAQN